MKAILRALTALPLLINLSACSYISASNSPVRDREMDYTLQPVENRYPLQTPSNLTAPTLTPKLIIPPGQNFYPAGPPTPMTPPGFNDIYPVAAAPVKYQMSDS